MTGAGERARELAAIHEAIGRGWNKWEAASCKEPLCGCVTGWIEREIEPVLAGALAAVRLEEAEWWEHLVGDCHGTELASECLYCERILKLRRAVEMGERAVEGK